MTQSTPNDAPSLVGPPVDTDLTSKGDDSKADPRQGLPDNVKVEAPKEGEKGFEPFRPDPNQPKAKSGKFVQYNGLGTVRTMKPEDWQAIGITDEHKDDNFQWNVYNKKRIPLDAFSDEQLQYLLRVDGRFSVVDIQEEDSAESK